MNQGLDDWALVCMIIMAYMFATVIIAGAFFLDFVL